MQDALKNLEAARGRVGQAFPYYGPVLCSLRFVERPAVGSFSVDKWRRLYYNPDYVLKRTIRELAGILFQIAEGILREQEGRKANRDPALWFLACLLETAEQIVEHPLVGLSPESIYPGYYNFPGGLAAEEYYVRLRRLEKIPLPWSGFGPNGEQVDSDFAFTLGDYLSPILPGSIFLDIELPWEDDEPGISEFRIDPLLAAGLNSAVEREARRHHGGHKAGDLSDFMLSRVKPKESLIDWRDKLLHEIGISYQAGAGSTIYSWSIPNPVQQSIASDLILPSYDSSSPSVLIIVDTSGSMNEEHLEHALGEIDGCIQTLCAADGIFVMPTDAKAKPVQKVYSGREVHLIGGGGTNMGAGLLKAEEFYPLPDCVLVITDGYTDWPKQKPSRLNSVIGLNVSRDWPIKGRKDYPVPKWLNHIEMYPAEKKAA